MTPWLRLLRLRFLVLAAALLASEAAGQGNAGARSRWELGVAALGGPGLLLGGVISHDIVQARGFHIQAEIAALTSVTMPPDVMNPNSAGGSDAWRPPFVKNLVVIGARGIVPLGHRWFAATQIGGAWGDWWYPYYEPRQSFSIGAGVGRTSKSGRRSLELRLQQVAARDRPSNGVLLSWRYGL